MFPRNNKLAWYMTVVICVLILGNTGLGTYFGRNFLPGKSNLLISSKSFHQAHDSLKDFCINPLRVIRFWKQHQQQYWVSRTVSCGALSNISVTVDWWIRQLNNCLWGASITGNEQQHKGFPKHVRTILIHDLPKPLAQPFQSLAKHQHFFLFHFLRSHTSGTKSYYLT